MRGVIGSVLVAVLLGTLTATAAQLPPEIMADRYLLQAERLIAEKNHKAALEVMDKIVALQREHNLTLPDEFHFKYAQIAMSARSIKAVIDSVNKYLATAGRAGKHYREALELLDEAEQEEARRKQRRKKEEARRKQRRKKEEARRKHIRPILPEMAVIPGGSFRMGCVSGKNCSGSELPVHEVRVASFELSKYEVMFEEYDRFTAATGRELVSHRGLGLGRQPVIDVSWTDAVAYTEWLSAETGERYRLPSEAEWEYAALAGSTTKYHFGDDESKLCDYANHADRDSIFDFRNRACSDGVRWSPTTVGKYFPNAFGLHDMHGNLQEWVQDCWNESYRGAPTDGSAWESGDCRWRVRRGGSWRNNPWSLRSAARGVYRGLHMDVNGVRVARTLAP